MPRYKLTIEYDGAPFCGWQSQADQVTVQGVLTAAVAALTGEAVPVQGAGRTDAGVHARGQVASVELSKDWETDTVRDALNAHLRPHPVSVLKAERAAADFNARMSAVKRHYFYRIVNRRSPLTFDVKYAAASHGRHVFRVRERRTIRGLPPALRSLASPSGCWSRDGVGFRRRR